MLDVNRLNAGEEHFRKLLIRGLAGDEPAYHEFLQELSTHLRSFLQKRLASLPDEVEDLVQESLLAIHNQRHTYDAKQPVTAWIHAIAKYKLIDLLRRRERRDLLTDSLDDDASQFELASTANAEAASDARRDLSKLLEQLPDGQRLPIVHMKLEGLSVAETARLTGMSESAVKVGVHRGLKAMAALIRSDT
ncbi:MAG: sigma-70 family RNA polymerase sigma factor [Gammaproteobacteria bacterium]|nr:sigma-70 family RNA polymerase sigma factor [Rhodocyclaceae bacterium]MBU3908707.1 sigma-70 family RNA polymerase sigma factor [Gammaproteobacteria bacterium]MBU3988829.1 sigma-70 family RNA polymerase sigma factor [Gammaproteobacteria bacterium]MBU4004735.1 sigma-70 family RNA polymerase sigma factor [Gammaproteobacteria bacterium]MBU4021338.1 sigma-70 family RNA polymerase sigma factor [Gammaproteobacteria bacterium]